MAKITSSASASLRNLIRSKITIGILVVLVIGVGGYFLLFRHTAAYRLVAVQRGPISESVSLTGNTAPAQRVSLAFSGSGAIARVYSALGKRVGVGQVLAALNTSDLAAGVRSAQATVDAQKAKLEGLQAGARPEDIAVSQAALDKAKQDLANMYAGIADTSTDAYAKATDALRLQLDPFFSNAETNTPKLTYVTANSQAAIDAEAHRPLATNAVNKWQGQLAGFDQSNAGLEALLQAELSYLATIRELLGNLSKTLDVAPALSASTLAVYKADVSTALNEVNAASKNLNAISQNIASQKLTVSQSQAQLDLKKAGSLPTDISAQQAQIEQAQASLDSAAVKLQNAQVVAPIAGTITQFDAKAGQQASPSAAIISIMSDAGYEVDAGVSETDVGKVSVGDTVAMTLDAFPGETFPGSVFYIAPSETNMQGVVSYAIKISFDKPDTRLKSGLTANITIETKHKDSVLFLPQYAILQNDSGTFVQTLEDNKTVKEIPVTLGIRDQNGNVEIVSGVSESQQVLNIGLKTP